MSKATNDFRYSNLLWAEQLDTELAFGWDETEDQYTCDLCLSHDKPTTYCWYPVITDASYVDEINRRDYKHNQVFADLSMNLCSKCKCSCDEIIETSDHLGKGKDHYDIMDNIEQLIKNN